MSERLFTVNQIAELLCLDATSVIEWIGSGRLESQRLPDGSARISEQQLLRFF